MKVKKGEYSGGNQIFTFLPQQMNELFDVKRKIDFKRNLEDYWELFGQEMCLNGI